MPNTDSRRTVVLLMTDVEGSTPHWERSYAAMAEAMRLHDALAPVIASKHGGYLPKGRGEGDSALFVFPSVAGAFGAAREFVVSVAAAADSVGLEIRLRASVHAGDVLARDEDLYGPTLNRCARIRGIAHPGQVLVSQTAEALARLAENRFVLRKLGQIRLRDLIEPEVVYQLLGDGLQEDFPPLRSIDQTPNNLPFQPTSFHGRQEAIRQVSEMLTRDRQVTLHGPGGVGKTRLALEVASGQLGEFPDGVWLVDLAPVEREEEVFAVAARVLAASSQQDAEAIATHLGTSRVLVVIDNCEHISASARKLCVALINKTPNVRVLATSRHGIGFAGERVFPLVGLAAPPTDSSLVDLGQVEGVQMLVDRARHHDPGFELTTANSAAVNHVVRRLDGLPLAIELAAARLRIMSPQQLLERLNDFFRALGAGPADSLPRHRTIDASIRWSYELLGPEERTLFLALGQFAGGWSIDIVEQLHGPLGLSSDALALAASLADKSMIVGGDRMRMLVPLREFAALRISDEPTVADAFLSWARESSEEAFESQDKGLSFAQAEGENLWPALDRAIATQRFPEAFSIARVMYQIWYAAGPLEAGERCIRAVLEMAPEPSSTEAAALNDNAGVLAWRRGDLEAAEISVRRAAQVWAQLSDLRAEGRALGHLGFILYGKGRMSEAHQALEEAYVRLKATGAAIELAHAATNLGNYFHGQGRYAEASPYFDEALEVARRLGDQRTIGAVTNLLAEPALADGDLSKARELLAESLDAVLRLGDLVGAADTMLTTADLLWKEGRAESAARAIAALRAILDKTGQALEPGPASRLEDIVCNLGESEEGSRLKRIMRHWDAADPLAACVPMLVLLRGPDTNLS